jgi:hypothetical protein
MPAEANLLTLIAVTCCVFSTACTNWAARSTQENGTTQQNVSHPQRYVPVGNNPEIALDTETGVLCRTIADTNAPLDILDPSCAVDQEQKKLGFIPIACKNGKTWVRGEGDKSPSPYTKLPTCGANRTAAPQPANTPAGSVSVTAPDGVTYVFPNQKTANDFKAAAHIQSVPSDLQQSSPSEQQKVAPTPQTHVFSVSKWQAANPKGDANAARAEAKRRGYFIVP